MLSLTDPRWPNLKGGRRTPINPRPLLRKLESGENTKWAWEQLWDELHHQGDVDESSYACVPHLIRIYQERSVLDWNPYAIVGIIELARTEGDNPDVPQWLAESYHDAIRELATLGASQIRDAQDQDTVRAILCILAIAHGARAHANFLIDYSEEELQEMKEAAGY
jgi:hypothetical protein